MFVYLQAYEQGATTARPLLAFVSIYRGAIKVFETPAVELSQGMNNPLQTIPLNFNIALDQLSPGEYNCQVTVLDHAEQKSAFWRASLRLVP